MPLEVTGPPVSDSEYKDDWKFEVPGIRDHHKSLYAQACIEWRVSLSSSYKTIFDCIGLSELLPDSGMSQTLQRQDCNRISCKVVGMGSRVTQSLTDPENFFMDMRNFKNQMCYGIKCIPATIGLGVTFLHGIY